MSGIVTRQDELNHYRDSLRKAQSKDKQVELILHNLQGYRRGNNQLKYDVESFQLWMKALAMEGIQFT